MKRTIYSFIVGLVVLTGCTKNFLDINTDPNNPTTTSLNRLLPAAEQGMVYALGFTNDNRGARGISEVLSVYQHQVVVREDPDQYGATGSDINIVGSWTGTYSSAPAQVGSDVLGCLQNVEVIITQGTEEDNKIYTGIAKIMKAYLISQFVDIYGDVPFSQANKLISEGIRYPKYDKDSEIYPQLFTLLDAGISDLTATAANPAKPGTDDLIYGGDVDLWVRAANTIKLKLYNQVRLVQNVSTQVSALIAADHLIEDMTGSFMLKYGKGTTPDDRNPGYNDYFAGQKSHYMSPWFWAYLKGYNPNILTNNPDPRIPYYFYKQLTADEASQNPSEYRDGGFLSIVFGSIGPNRDFSQDQSMTVFGIYPVGGRYDDGGAIKVNANSSTGAAPFKMLTYADLQYIKAELMSAGVLAGDARATFANALSESMNMVDYVVTLVGNTQTIPKLAGSAGATTFQNKVMAEYDAGSAAKKLQLIMTEKWVGSFGSSVDQYTDYRRTGYPILFDPNNPAQAPGGRLQPPIGGDPSNPIQPSVPVQLTRAFPLSLPWSNDDLSVNVNAPPQKLPATARVFWDKD